MSGDSRRAHARIDVSRPVELAELDEYGAVVGYTKDLSETGVRARFDVTPQTSADVLVRLFLEDGIEPVEKRGKVVWSAPDIYGDGTEVGLRLLDDGIDCADAERGSLPPDLVLCVGQPARVTRGGVAYDGVIAEIGEPDPAGRIPLFLDTAAVRLAGDAPAAAAAEPQAPVDEHELDAEQWKPHPLRDALATARRILRPVARVIAPAALLTLAFLARVAGLVWSKVPAQPRASAESLLRRARVGLARLRTAAARPLVVIAARLRARRAKHEE
jgi:hypothetical protein